MRDKSDFNEGKVRRDRIGRFDTKNQTRIPHAGSKPLTADDVPDMHGLDSRLSNTIHERIPGVTSEYQGAAVGDSEHILVTPDKYQPSDRYVRRLTRLDNPDGSPSTCIGFEDNFTNHEGNINPVDWTQGDTFDFADYTNQDKAIEALADKATEGI